MKTDSQRMRGERKFTFTNLKQNDGVDVVSAFIVEQGMV